MVRIEIGERALPDGATTHDVVITQDDTVLRLPCGQQEWRAIAVSCEIRDALHRYTLAGVEGYGVEG